MELWGWIVGYVILFALLHLLLYYVYVRRSDGRSISPSLDADGNRSGPGYSPPTETLQRDRETVEEDAPEGAIQCVSCGTVNELDPAFTYCHNCITPLQ